MEKDIIDKVEILFFTEKEEVIAYPVVQILNDLITAGEGLLVNGQNLMKLRLEKSSIPKKLKELKDDEFLRKMIEEILQ